MKNEYKLQEIIKELRDEAYNDGLRDGLKIAEKIADWLNFQPPRKWSQKIRGYALKEIEKARNKK